MERSLAFLHLSKHLTLTQVKTTQQQTHVNTNTGNDHTFELRIKIEMYEDHRSDKQIQKNTNAPLEKDTPVRETYRWYTGFRLVAPRK